MVSSRVDLVVLAVAVCGCACAQQGSPPAATRERTLASVRELHDFMITPASDGVFGAAGETPVADDGWRDARKQALLLGESGNLLMLDGRVVDNESWMTMARALVDAAALAVTAAERKDADGLAQASDSIAAACEACHQPYRDQGRRMLGTGQ